MQTKEIYRREQQEGLAVFDDGKDSIAVLQEFCRTQTKLLETYQKQNSGMKRWNSVILTFLAMSFMAGITYHFYMMRLHDQRLLKQSEERSELKALVASKVEKSTQAVSKHVYERLDKQNQRYKEEMKKLHRFSVQGYQKMMGFLFQLQTEQRQLEKSYQDKILTVNKEKLALQDIKEKLTKDRNHLINLTKKDELTIYKAKANIEELQTQIAHLKKRLQKYEIQIKYLKNQAAAKLTQDDAAKIKRELETDE